MFRFVDHVRRRWRVVVVACGVAMGLALVVALLTPNQFTATTRVLIEPPGGGGMGAPMAVSPVYLESLKTYELVASGDQLFANAIDHFHVPRTRSIEQLKSRILKVQIPRNTKVLEISATLENPQRAQQLALYIAEQTVQRTRALALEADRDAITDAEKQWQETQPRAETPGASKSQTPMQLAMEAADMRLQRARSSGGDRGERLKIIDPGVLPERPSWPKPSLIAVSAMLAALIGSLLYLAFEFSYSVAQPGSRPVEAGGARQTFQ